MEAKTKLALFASHNGSNVQAILDACEAGTLDAQVCAVISNNSGAYALERARQAGIPAFHLSAVAYPAPEALDQAILRTLLEAGTEWVFLAGYMKKLGPKTLERYSGRVLNTHPSLLPKFGGHGMFGSHVHAAVLEAGEAVTGVTVHQVVDEYDEGPIVAQSEVPVRPGDTVETLSARVQERERELVVSTLQRLFREGRSR